MPYGDPAYYRARPKLGIRRLGWDAREQVLDGELLPEYLQERYESTSATLLEKVEEVFQQAGDVRDLVPRADHRPHLADHLDARVDGAGGRGRPELRHVAV